MERLFLRLGWAAWTVGTGLEIGWDGIAVVFLYRTV